MITDKAALFGPSPLSHNSHNYFVEDEGRCLSYISLSWGLSFFHDFIIFPGKKGCSLFEIVSSLFLYFEWRHRWRQDLTDLVHPITQGNSLRASSPRGTEVGRGGGGRKEQVHSAPDRQLLFLSFRNDHWLPGGHLSRSDNFAIAAGPFHTLLSIAMTGIPDVKESHLLNGYCSSTLTPKGKTE